MPVWFYAPSRMQLVNDVVRHFMSRCALAEGIELTGSDGSIVANAGCFATAILSGRLAPQIKTHFRHGEIFPVELVGSVHPAGGYVQEFLTLFSGEEK